MSRKQNKAANMKTNKKTNETQNENYLDRIPVHKKDQRWEQDASGAITLYQENTGLMNRIAQKCFRKPAVSQIHLDEMGNFIWPLLDGERTVYQLAQLVKEEFGEKAEPLYDRLIKYLEILRDYGFMEWKL